MPTKSVETVAIVDLGNDIQLTYSVSGFVYTFNKLQLKTKQTDKFVYITNGDGFENSFSNQVLRLHYTEVSAPSGLTSNGDLFDAIAGMVSGVSLGSSGGGGSDNIYSNASGDFVATPTVGAKTITITGLPYTLTAIQVAGGSLKKINAAGEVSTLNMSSVAVSGGVITLAGEDNFETGDQILASLAGPDKAYDEALDSDITTVLNPDYEKWTSQELLIDLAVDAETNRFVIPMEGYKDLSTHRKITAGGTVDITLWGTNNPDADDTADTDWVDITADYFAKATSGTSEVAEVSENIFFMKLMIKVVTTGTTNLIDVYIKKKAL